MICINGNDVKIKGNPVRIKRILIGLLIGLYIAASAIMIAGTLYFGF